MKILLNVGAEKSGTTWLYQYFKSHPEFETVGKELNVIQRDDLVPVLEDVGNARKDLNEYFKLLISHGVTGDFTHYEGSSENVFRLLKDGFSTYDAEVVPVYIMRDPIKRAWASWHMLGSGPDLEMPKAAFFLLQNYLNCKYKETIEALDNVFDKPLYFFYEDFFKQDNLDLICDALNICHHPIDLEVVNKGLYTDTPTDEFIEKFGNTQKNRDAVEFIFERFDNVPWAIEDYKKIET